MPVLSYVHQLFDVDQCQTYIHTLRWQDRPLQCPRCQSQDVDPWGSTTTDPGANATGVTAASAPSTISPTPCSSRASGRSRSGCWRPFCCVSPARRDALPGRWGSSRTSYRWCWWLRHAALSYEMHRQLAGTVEADDLSHTAGQKGQAPHGGKKALGRRARGRRKPREPGRGPYDKDRPAMIAWVRPRSGRHPGDPRLHGANGAKGRGPCGARGQSALHGLGQQLSGGDGLCA